LPPKRRVTGGEILISRHPQRVFAPNGRDGWRQWAQERASGSSEIYRQQVVRITFESDSVRRNPQRYDELASLILELSGGIRRIIAFMSSL
jgi:hypothetical protein